MPVSRSLTVRLLLAAAVSATAALTTVASAEDGPVTLADVSIPASDGVELVGDVHLPAAKGRFPAVVDMEPYGRSSDDRLRRRGLRPRQHRRPRLRQERRRPVPALRRASSRTSYDVVEWVAKQPWSNGKVALYGYSYSAITALLGAAQAAAAPDGGRRRPPADRPLPRRALAQRPLRPGLRRPVVRRARPARRRSASARSRRRSTAGPAVRRRDAPDDRSTARSTRSARCSAKVEQHHGPRLHDFTGWQDMYSRGDLRLHRRLASKTPRCSWIDASTHHGTGQAGEVGAPYGDAPLGLDAGLNTPLPDRRGRGVARPLRQGRAQRRRPAAARALLRPGRPHAGTTRRRGGRCRRA